MAVFTLHLEPEVFQPIVGKWANHTFPLSNPLSIVRHLEEEVKELGEALARAVDEGRQPETGEIEQEAGDCLLLLMHLAHKLDFNLYHAAEAKWAEDQKSEWEGPDDPAAIARGYWKKRDSNHLPE